VSYRHFSVKDLALGSHAMMGGCKIRLEFTSAQANTEILSLHWPANLDSLVCLVA
jgi:hypothetical protein